MVRQMEQMTHTLVRVGQTIVALEMATIMVTLIATVAQTMEVAQTVEMVKQTLEEQIMERVAMMGKTTTPVLQQAVTGEPTMDQTATMEMEQTQMVLVTLMAQEDMVMVTGQLYHW